jgi:TPR repeat protein
MAIDKGHINSMFNFGLYYKRIKDYDNMIKYYKLASDKGHQKSKLKLDDYYKKNKPHKNKEENKEDNSIKFNDDIIIIDI